MEMYAANNGSSFGASLTLQTSNSFRDVSFSSYLNQAEEHMIRKITNQNHYRNNSEEDQELGVFGAEKYFKGEIEDVNNKNIGAQTFIGNYEIRSKMKLETDETNAHTPSVRSNVSSNSRIRLLPRQNQTPGILERRTKSKTSINFLSRFGCNCINKKSTQIISKPPPPPNPKLFDFDPKTASFPSKLTERQTRNDYFSFPILNSNDLNSNSISSSNSNNNNNYSNSISGNLAGKVNGENNNNNNNSNNNKKKNRGCLSLGKKLSLLNDWDVDIPTEDEMYMPSSGMYNNDADSDSSSDLFEIESFSTTGNNSFIDHRKSESNGYAPSEVSVDWSVVTASAADFSVISDYEELRSGGGGGGGWRISGRNDHGGGGGGGGGILSGCVSNKAVRVAGDEYKVSRGAAGGRRRLSDSMAVGNLFRGGLI